MTVAQLLTAALNELAKVKPVGQPSVKALKRAKARIREAQTLSGQAAVNRLDTALTELAKVKVNDAISNEALATGKLRVREAKTQIEGTIQPPPPPPEPEPEPEAPPSSGSIRWGARIDGEVYGGRGDAPWDSGTWDTFEQHTGKRVSLIHWGQPLGAFDLNAANLARQRGAMNLVSVDTAGHSLTEIKNGGYDAQIKAFAERVEQFNDVVWFRVWWEMNGSWYAWGRNPDYVAAWQRYVGLVRGIAPNARFVWCPNVIWDAASLEWMQRSYPGDGYVDLVGIDGYNFNTPWKWPAEVFEPTMAELTKLVGPSKPFVICETASTEAGGSKADWIRRYLGWLPQHTRVAAFAWFNWNIVESGTRRDWPIESSTSAQSAFAEGIASSYFQ